MTHHSNKATDRSSDKYGGGAVTTTPGSTRQDAEGVYRARDDQPAGAEDCRGTAGQIVKTTPTTQQVTDQSATIEQLNTAATESTTFPLTGKVPSQQAS